MTSQSTAGRANQKLRTRTAIVQAAAELSRTGREVTMPEIAKAALVSEATAYRYFPDLASLLREAIAGQLPAAAEALQPVADSDDLVERVAAEALFSLLDLYGLDPEDAVTSIVHTATTLTSAASGTPRSATPAVPSGLR